MRKGYSLKIANEHNIQQYYSEYDKKLIVDKMCMETRAKNRFIFGEKIDGGK